MSGRGKLLKHNELKDAFYSLKFNESPGYNEINIGMIKQYFGNLHTPLHHLFNFSLKSDLFPDEM